MVVVVLVGPLVTSNSRLPLFVVYQTTRHGEEAVKIKRMFVDRVKEGSDVVVELRP